MIQEIQRKLFHLTGFIYVIALAKLQRSWFIALVSAVWIVVVLLETLRLKNPTFQQWCDRSFGSLLRDQEKHHLSGVSWMILGVLSSALLLSPPLLAMTPILYLLLGDAAASLVGKSVKGPKWPRSDKSISGSLGCFFVCLAVGFFCLLPTYGWLLVFLGAAVATLVEKGPLPVNDNLSIPLLSALFFKLWI